MSITCILGIQKYQTYQADNQTVANVAENILAGGGIILSEAFFEIDHGSETRDLT